MDMYQGLGPYERLEPFEPVYRLLKSERLDAITPTQLLLTLG